MRATWVVALAAAGVCACSGGESAQPDGGDDVAVDSAIALDSGAATRDVPPGPDVSQWPDAILPDGRVVRGPYVTRVVSFTPGPSAGFGQSEMPDIVYGPPVGAGEYAGSTDVVSLGVGGQICVEFEDVTIVDGPGVDFVVFENPFIIDGSNLLYDELGEVSVSADGVNFVTFPCTQTGPPYTGCAGWNPVYSNPSDGIQASDLTHAGGDPFDLATVGLTEARYVCVRDLQTQPPVSPKAGFDLDAMIAINWQ